ncbi:MAG: hypothetical protein PUB35_00855 [Campylobacteraceae bacterium]|nr:hypothetical protein [Campylobacteraceae bacterium]
MLNRHLLVSALLPFSSCILSVKVFSVSPKVLGFSLFELVYFVFIK